MRSISLFHTVCGVACLLLGASIFFNTKAGRFHRTTGRIYIACMCVLNLTALCIYHLSGRFNLFHAFAVIILAMVLIGWAQVLFRRHLANWFYRHYMYMSWSYAGLIAASSNEAFVRIPVFKSLVQRHGNCIILVTQAVIVGVAALLLARNKQGLYQRYSPAR